MTPERIAALRETLAFYNWAMPDDGELAELLTLSERYLWLRDGPFVVLDEDDEMLFGADLDAAIDAAMKGGEGNG